MFISETEQVNAESNRI